MNTRIHAYLDGEIPRDMLSPDEIAELVRTEQVIEQVSSSIRAHPGPDLRARVMAELPGSPSPSRPERIAARVRTWMVLAWAPRTFMFQVRPAYSLGLAMATLLFAVGPLSMTHPPAAPVREAGTAPVTYVQFRLDMPDAARVELAGSFTGWIPEYELRQSQPGVWTALVPVQPGAHEYLFVVDGREWVPDPTAGQVEDDFGGVNSRLLISALHAQI